MTLIYSNGTIIQKNRLVQISNQIDQHYQKNISGLTNYSKDDQWFSISHLKKKVCIDTRLSLNSKITQNIQAFENTMESYKSTYIKLKKLIF